MVIDDRVQDPEQVLALNEQRLLARLLSDSKLHGLPGDLLDQLRSYYGEPELQEIPDDLQSRLGELGDQVGPQRGGGWYAREGPAPAYVSPADMFPQVKGILFSVFYPSRQGEVEPVR